MATGQRHFTHNVTTPSRKESLLFCLAREDAGLILRGVSIPKLVVLIGALPLAAGLAFALNWLALIPWRRSRGAHWTEQARLLYPVRAGARSNLWVIPLVIAFGGLLYQPETPTLWVFAGVAAAVGALAGTLPMDRETIPRIPFPDLARQSALFFLMRLLFWLVFAGATIAMPDKFNAKAMVLGVFVLSLWILWAWGGFVRVGRILGLFQPAPRHLSEIVAVASARINVPARGAFMARIPMAQAAAFPMTGELMFTQRLLEILKEDEVAAVCAHELGHLTERSCVRWGRMIQAMWFFPYVFLKPILAGLGALSLFALPIASVCVSRGFLRISRKMELRADQMAVKNEGDEKTYARALLRLYEDNLAPAALEKKSGTHPDLYDRLLAAGMTPDFPRPKPARTMAWNGWLLAGAAGVVFGLYIARLGI